jgi:predicted DNA-binding transcriptional regulator YafY
MSWNHFLREREGKATAREVAERLEVSVRGVADSPHA